MAVVEVPPAVETDGPMPNASDDENASASIMPPWWRSRPCFVSSLHITPDDVMSRIELMSHFPGWSSSARSTGFANASPTHASANTFSRSMVSSSSAASNDRFSSVTMHPPEVMAASEVNMPVPCISGAAGITIGPGCMHSSRTLSRSGSAP